MKKVFGYLLAAAGGALIGGLATKIHLDKKYRQEIRKGEDALWDHYREKVTEKTELATAEANEALEIVKNELAQLRQKMEDDEKLRSLGVDPQKMTAKERELQLATAFIIKPEEWGTKPDYARFRYIFYPEQNEYVNSDYQTPVEQEELNDILGGIHPEDHFGEFEDDAVYVRNESLKVDIVIHLSEDLPDDEEDD